MRGCDHWAVHHPDTKLCGNCERRMQELSVSQKMINIIYIVFYFEIKNIKLAPRVRWPTKFATEGFERHIVTSVPLFII